MFKRILVVDDNTQLRELLREALEYCEFKVQILADGKGLLEAIEDFKPDLLILDNVLPGDSGELLCKSLREIGLSALPVLLISAYPEMIEHEDCFDAILFKPFDLDGLLEKVNKALKLPKSA